MVEKDPEHDTVATLVQVCVFLLQPPLKMYFTAFP